MDKPPHKTPQPGAFSSFPTQEKSLIGPYGPFRNTNLQKNILVFLLIIQAMMFTFGGVLEWLSIREMSSETYGPLKKITTLDQQIEQFSYAQQGISLVLIFVFLIWLTRSCKNAWLLDAPRIKTTPGWAIAYYFIPILQLWKPFTTMKEIRSASYGNDRPLRSNIQLWWAFWIAAFALETLSIFFILGTHKTEQALTLSRLLLISTPAFIILNVLTILLVTNITQAQLRRENFWKR